MAIVETRGSTGLTGSIFLAKMARSLVLLLCLGLSLTLAAAADPASQTNLWQAAPMVFQNSLTADTWVQPASFRAFTLDQPSLQAALKQTSKESLAPAAVSDAVITLPLPDGSLTRFRFVESPIMAPELAAQFPEIKTYIGQSLDDPNSTVRFDSTPTGFHAQILSPSGAVYIDPYQRGNTNLHLCYFKRDLQRTATDFQCFNSSDSPISTKKPMLAQMTPSLAFGGNLRTYRLACAATAEYTQFFGGTVAAGMAAIATAVNRVTGIYESELGIRLVLVASNNLIVYTNTTTDPYTDNNSSLLISQNQSNLDYVIGNSNYDIGHVFGTAGGGLAGVGVVCVTGLKAHGETGAYPPTGDAFLIDYVAHEMGHQFGATHTFNSTNSACNGNRCTSTAYEPGSGSTIMSYAGICGTDNLGAHSSPYFHSASFDQITACITTGSASVGGVSTANGNHPPTVSAGSNFTIPKGTPFSLTATGSDPDGDALSWCWEERDLGPSITLAAADNGSSPLLRSFSPSTNLTRTIPQLSDILNNTNTPGERLPTTSRTMNFRVTARDNRAGGGGLGTADMQVTVDATAGPFRVTSPATPVTWSGLRTVTWDVSGTTNAAIHVTSVNILLSTDGGVSFPFMLATNAANNGSQTILLPNLSTSSARIKVQAVGNIFFDISHTNFSITPSTADLAVGQSASASTINAGNPLSYTLQVTNLGPNVASGIVLTDSLPSGLTFASAVASQGACTFTNGVLICNLGVLTNGAKAFVTLTTLASSPGSCTNKISASASSTDSVSANNSAAIVVTVNAVHNGPALPAQSNQALSAQSTLVVSNTAVDTDIPQLALTYQLINPPAGAAINTNGIITWTPAQNLTGNYTFKTVVTDSGTPHLSATNVFSVSLQSAVAIVAPPLIQTLAVSNAVATITWGAVAGQTYRLQYKDSLGSPTWHDISPTFTANGPTASATDSTTNSPQRFYRVAVGP